VGGPAQEEDNVQELHQPPVFDDGVSAGDQSSPAEATSMEPNMADANQRGERTTEADRDRTNNDPKTEEGSSAQAAHTNPLLREPLESPSFARRAGGNSTHTARMLKKLNSQTAALQHMVDDLTIQVKHNTRRQHCRANA
jgi:hypothetical protein